MNLNKDREVDLLLNGGVLEFTKDGRDNTYRTLCSALEKQKPVRNMVYILLDHDHERAFAGIQVNCFRGKVGEILIKKIGINGIWKTVESK